MTQKPQISCRYCGRPSDCDILTFINSHLTSKMFIVSLTSESIDRHFVRQVLHRIARGGAITFVDQPPPEWEPVGSWRRTRVTLSPRHFGRLWGWVGILTCNKASWRRARSSFDDIKRTPAATWIQLLFKCHSFKELATSFNGMLWYYASNSVILRSSCILSVQQLSLSWCHQVSTSISTGGNLILTQTQCSLRTTSSSPFRKSLTAFGGERSLRWLSCTESFDTARFCNLFFNFWSLFGPQILPLCVLERPVNGPHGF